MFAINFPGWVISIYRWLTEPSVTMLIGSLSAVIASFFLDTKKWTKSLKDFLIRAVWIIVVWIVAVTLLTWLTPSGGTGIGAGGPNSEGSKGKTTNIESSNGETTERRPSQGNEGMAAPPSGPGRDPHIKIRFIPSDNSPGEAQPFQCIITYNDVDTKINSPDMVQFRTAITENFLRVNTSHKPVPTKDSPLSIHIDRKHFPGNEILAEIKAITKKTIIFQDLTIGDNDDER